VQDRRFRLITGAFRNCTSSYPPLAGKAWYSRRVVFPTRSKDTGFPHSCIFFMTNHVVHAFFVGRAVAQALNEQLEDALTNALSELGKFDAEQRERLRQFTQQVIEQAEREAETTMLGRTTTTLVPQGVQPVDLQATIDELRAEIARLRAELQLYRSRSV